MVLFFVVMKLLYQVVGYFMLIMQVLYLFLIDNGFFAGLYIFGVIYIDL